MAQRSLLLQSPSQINIIRTAISCPDTPREVGDGMETKPPLVGETQATKLITSYPASITSSGYSVPIFPHSPRLVFEKRSSVQRSIDQDEESLHPESLPSPVPSDFITRKTENFLIEEKAALSDHLRIQVQVNQELKKLLVASIGEDMGFHYERIATEKAQLEMENEELMRKINIQEEETERLNISCDVWRSKFLASRVQCDEAQETVIKLQRKQREMETAVRGLLREHRMRSENLEEIRDTLKHLNDALQWSKKSDKAKAKKSPPAQIDEECLTLSNQVSSRLLGSSKPVVSKKGEYKKFLSSWKRVGTPGKFTTMTSEPEYEVKQTLAEKYVLQLLRDSGTGAPSSGVKNLEYYSKPLSTTGSVSGRFHPDTKYENITLACCSKCKGDIYLI